MAADQLPMKTVGQLYDMMYKDALTKKALGQTPEKVSELDRARAREIDEKIIQMGKVVKPSAADEALTRQRLAAAGKLEKETSLLGELQSKKLELADLDKRIKLAELKYGTADSIRDQALASKTMANLDLAKKKVELQIKELESKDKGIGLDPKLTMTLGDLANQITSSDTNSQQKMVIAKTYNQMLPDNATQAYAINRDWDRLGPWNALPAVIVSLPFLRGQDRYMNMKELREEARNRGVSPEDYLWLLNEADKEISKNPLGSEFVS